MLMQNVYTDRRKVELEKMCKKPSKGGNGDLCISVQDEKEEGSFHNHQITKERFLNFVLKNYKKEMDKKLN